MISWYIIYGFISEYFLRKNIMDSKWMSIIYIINLVKGDKIFPSIINLVMKKIFKKY